MLKKFIAFWICFSMVYSPAYCAINDDFVGKTLSKDLTIQKAKNPVIVDEFTENSLAKRFNATTLEYKIIEDNFAQNNKNKNTYSKPKIDFAEQIIVAGEKSAKTKKTVIITEENTIPIKIRIKKHLSTRHKVDEGDYIEFETLSEVKIKDKVYPRGTTIQARIETISQNKIWGVPWDLVIGNFAIDGKSLQGEITKTGANRSLWLYPTIYITTFFFGFGLLLIPIRGGHAKISPTQTYTINYAN